MNKYIVSNKDLGALVVGEDTGEDEGAWDVREVVPRENKTSSVCLNSRDSGQ